MRHSAFRIPHSALESGQAMIELAVFGAIMIAALGMLLRYSLTAQYTQQTKMRAFRNALMIASRPSDQEEARRTFPMGGGASLIIDQRLIPDPTHAFGLGSMVPMFASESVIRDPRMDTAEDSDLKMRVELNNQVLPEFAAADLDEDMGFDPDATATERKGTVDTVLVKTEDGLQISTVSGVAWDEEETGRAFQYPGGYVPDVGDADGDGNTTELISTTTETHANEQIREEHSTSVWTTPWGEQ